MNPEALEGAREPFKERRDYVIVLRVLTEEDIYKLVERTKQIRGKDSASIPVHNVASITLTLPCIMSRYAIAH